MLTTYDLDIQTRPRFSPIYTTAKLKADTCNSFQVIMQTDRQTHTHTHSSTKWKSQSSSVQFSLPMCTELWTIPEHQRRLLGCWLNSMGKVMWLRYLSVGQRVTGTVLSSPQVFMYLYRLSYTHPICLFEQISWLFILTWHVKLVTICAEAFILSPWLLKLLHKTSYEHGVCCQKVIN